MCVIVPERKRRTTILVKVYHHNLKNWSSWLTHQPLGHRLILRTRQRLADSIALQRNLQKVSLIGVPAQRALFSDLSIKQSLSLIPEAVFQGGNTQIADSSGFANTLVTDWFELPMQTASVDVCVLPHSLEFSDYPRKLFQEACRMIKPEGLMVIIGFNPYGFWSLPFFSGLFPKPSHFLSAKILKNWLSLEGFQIESHTSFLFGLPVLRAGQSSENEFIERILPWIFPKWGGAYCLIARAKVLPLSPIRVQWRQKFTSSAMPVVFGCSAYQKSIWG